MKFGTLVWEWGFDAADDIGNVNGRVGNWGFNRIRPTDIFDRVTHVWIRPFYGFSTGLVEPGIDNWNIGPSPFSIEINGSELWSGDIDEFDTTVINDLDPVTGFPNRHFRWSALDPNSFIGPEEIDPSIFNPYTPETVEIKMDSGGQPLSIAGLGAQKEMGLEYRSGVLTIRMIRP